MPGLVGIIDQRKKLGIRKIERLLYLMSDSLQHEEGYHTNVYIEKNFGIVRISKRPSQDFPYKSPDPQNNNLMFLYGDIYVYDGKDVLGEYYFYDFLSALEKDFSKAITKIDGDFVFIFYNNYEQKIYIVNDLSSSIPIYYTIIDDVFYFAPEIKALLKIPFLDKQINFGGISHFLSSGMVYLNDTYFTNIASMMISSVISVNLLYKKIVQYQYWSFNFLENIRDKGTNYYSEGLIYLINKAVRRRIKDKESRKIGIFLSGGFDSRTILGSCLQNNANLKTITHGVSQDKPFSDAFIAKKLANKLGVKNYFYHLNPNQIEHHLEKIVFLTDGLTDQVGNYADGLQNYRQIKKDFDVALRGEELFGWQGGAFNEGDALASYGLVPLSSRFSSILNEKYYEELSKYSKFSLNKLSKTSDLKNLVNRKDFFVWIQGIPNFWGRLNYLKNTVIDVRNPFLDKELLEFIAKMPPKYRLYRKLFRSSVVSAFPNIFNIGYATTSNLPNWTEYYRKYQNLRTFIRTSLIDLSAPFFNELVNKKKLNLFILKFEAAAFRNKQKSEILSVKAFQSTSLFKKITTTNFKTTLIQLIRSNYHLYKLLLPFLKYREITDSWLNDDIIIMRLLVIQNWGKLFLNNRY